MSPISSSWAHRKSTFPSLPVIFGSCGRVLAKERQLEVALPFSLLTRKHSETSFTLCLCLSANFGQNSLPPRWGRATRWNQPEFLSHCLERKFRRSTWHEIELWCESEIDYYCVKSLTFGVFVTAPSRYYPKYYLQQWPWAFTLYPFSFQCTESFSCPLHNYLDISAWDAWESSSRTKGIIEGSTVLLES